MKSDIYWMSAVWDSLASSSLPEQTNSIDLLTSIELWRHQKSERRNLKLYSALNARCTSHSRQIMFNSLTIQLCSRVKESPRVEKLNKLAIRKYYEVKRHVLSIKVIHVPTYIVAVRRRRQLSVLEIQINSVELLPFKVISAVTFTALNSYRWWSETQWLFFVACENFILIISSRGFKLLKV